jgi:hypothetical protein
LTRCRLLDGPGGRPRGSGTKRGQTLKTPCNSHSHATCPAWQRPNGPACRWRQEDIEILDPNHDTYHVNWKTCHCSVSFISRLAPKPLQARILCNTVNIHCLVLLGCSSQIPQVQAPNLANPACLPHQKRGYVKSQHPPGIASQSRPPTQHNNTGFPAAIRCPGPVPSPNNQAADSHDDRGMAFVTQRCILMLSA